MLNVTYKPFVLSVVRLSVVRLNVVILSVVAPAAELEPSNLDEEASVKHCVMAAASRLSCSRCHLNYF